MTRGLCDTRRRVTDARDGTPARRPRAHRRRARSRRPAATLVRRGERPDPRRRRRLPARRARQPVRRAAGRAHRRPPVPAPRPSRPAPPRCSSTRDPDRPGEPPLDALGDVTVVRVPDAAARRSTRSPPPGGRRFAPLVVGITGSIAKTSTKEAVAGVLARAASRRCAPRATRTTRSGCRSPSCASGPEHEAAVLEMGMYAGGEIRDLAAIGRPSIGIVTAVQPVHLSRIGTIDAIEDAKAELVEALPPAADGGVAILNADDARVAPDGRAARAARVVTYGFAPDADVRADDVESAGLRRACGSASRTPAGRARRRDPGARAARGPQRARRDGGRARRRDDARRDRARARRRRRTARAPLDRRPRRRPSRSSTTPTTRRPGSMRAALELLAGLPGRHVAVLGEMRELGDGPRRRPPRGRRGRGRALDLLVVVDGGAGRRRRGDRRRRPRGRPAPDRIVVGRRRATPRSRASARGCAPRRRRPRQGVARRRAGAGRRRRSRGRRPGADAGAAMTLELIQGLLLAFALVVILMPPYIRLLRHFGFGKQIREEGPQSHMVKWGTPTMGGLLIILVVLGIFLAAPLAAPGRRHRPARDARARRAAGRRRRLPQRPHRRGDPGPPEAAVADGRGGVRRVADPEHLRRSPASGCRSSATCSSSPWIYVPFAAFAIVAPRNGVNITDGLDGLAGGTLAFAFVVVHDHRAAQRPGPAATSRSCAR